MLPLMLLPSGFTSDSSAFFFNRADFIGVAEVTMTLVDRNLHGLGVLLEHGFLAVAELVAVLVRSQQ
jgi:hypothetical protein